MKARFILTTMPQSPSSYLIDIPVPSATFSSKSTYDGSLVHFWQKWHIMQSHTHTHMHAHTHMHTHTHARAHTHTHTCSGCSGLVAATLGTPFDVIKTRMMNQPYQNGKGLHYTSTLNCVVTTVRTHHTLYIIQ